MTPFQERLAAKGGDRSPRRRYRELKVRWRFRKLYFEAYLQYRPTPATEAWSAWWSAGL